MSLIPKRGTVYVVDDDGAVRDSVQWLLEGQDFRVRCFESAEAFLARYDRMARHPKLDLVLEIKVPVSTLCPCSKAISRRNAHNQRAILTIQVRCRELVWIEELIALAEAEASSSLYSLLKREDEKHITERAYRRPRFAEDISRAVAAKLAREKRIYWFKVESESLESIHNHNAYAMVLSGYPPGFAGKFGLKYLSRPLDILHS